MEEQDAGWAIVGYSGRCACEGSTYPAARRNHGLPFPLAGAGRYHQSILRLMASDSSVVHRPAPYLIASASAGGKHV